MEKEKVVVKFGGVSLKDSHRLKNTAKIIRKNLNKKLVVVISAIGDSTNALIKSASLAANGIVDYKEIKALHQDICQELSLDFKRLDESFKSLENSLLKIKAEGFLSKKNHDLVMSFGEQLSIIVLSDLLNTMGETTKPYNAWEIGLCSTSRFGNASILETSNRLIKQSIDDIFNQGVTPIITGFISKDAKGNITTLGRGGSDLTASYIAKSIEADEVILWKDVQGILTSNPKLVKNTKKINCLSYKEASEMAYFGAEILHPRAIFPAMDKDITITIKNFLEPEAKGTKIVNELNYIEEKSHIKTISYRNDITLVHIESKRMLGHYGFLAKVFQVFDALKISVDMIATSEVSISLTLDESHDLDALKESLSHFATVRITKNQSIVSLIGNTEESTSIFNQAFMLLDEAGINIKMVSYGASHVNIGFIIDSKVLKETINLLHEGLVYKEEVAVC